MMKLSEKTVRSHEVPEGSPNAKFCVGDPGPNLTQIFRCVADDMQAAEQHLAATLRDTKDPSARQIVDFLLESPGKRLRPALVLLSARAAGVAGSGSARPRLAWLNVAAAVELIHMASLVHDDLIDNGTLRHHRATIHAQWGRKVSIFLGDYLCAKAFQLVAACADPRLFAILGAQLCAMCEGEIQQVLGRGNFQMSAHRCLAMAEKKTAALFSACSGAGALAATGEPAVCKALQTFGLHFGVAFQVLDDCRDLLGDEKGLGKTPGQDLLAGDVTLPLLYVLRQCRHGEEEGPGTFPETRKGASPLSSPVPGRITRVIASHVARAKRGLEPLAASNYRDSLGQLADHIAAWASGILAR
jgi:geranylgeranyl pyrophosphate synthase